MQFVWSLHDQAIIISLVQSTQTSHTAQKLHFSELAIYPVKFKLTLFSPLHLSVCVCVQVCGELCHKVNSCDSTALHKEEPSPCCRVHHKVTQYTIGSLQSLGEKLYL